MNKLMHMFKVDSPQLILTRLIMTLNLLNKKKLQTVSLQRYITFNSHEGYETLVAPDSCPLQH